MENTPMTPFPVHKVSENMVTINKYTNNPTNPESKKCITKHLITSFSSIPIIFILVLDPPISRFLGHPHIAIERKIVPPQVLQLLREL